MSEGTKSPLVDYPTADCTCWSKQRTLQQIDMKKV